MTPPTTIERPGGTDRRDSARHASESTKILLISGKLTIPDRVGHHDYVAGCALLASLLEQTAGVNAVVAHDGWPTDERVFTAARSIVFYGGGGRKHALVSSEPRRRRIQELVDSGVGLVMIHQAVRYPPEHTAQAKAWLGGVHASGKSNRGHWPTEHHQFPDHPVTRGVPGWTIRDGWMNGIQFNPGLSGVTPLVWSGEEHRGSSDGGDADVASWAFDRPAGGRSFCFTGVDAHSAWSMPGVRQLVVNGILWSSGMIIPDGGAPSGVDESTLRALLTPRGSKTALVWKTIRRLARRRNT